MNARLLVVFGLVALIGGDFAYADEITTESLVKKHGYPFEKHSVETEDGYILRLNRIPFSPYQEPSNEQKQERPIALLMHGIFTSSSDWVVLGSRKALAYVLSDYGYDVWMGNARGTANSRRHIKYNSNALIGQFWDFSLHEIGTKDLPAFIDYIRNKTGQDKMTFLGHSQGATNFCVMSSLNETYQKYIKSAHFLAPLIYAEDAGLVINVVTKVFSLINPVATLAGDTEFRPNGTVTKLAGAALCDGEPRELCSDFLFILFGFNNITVDPSIISDVLATTPAGASTKSVLHDFQIYNRKYLQEYDYGLLRNLAKYKSVKPPAYPLEKITVPVYLYYGDEDKIIHKPDIDMIVENIPNVKGVFEIKGGTHQSPLYGVASVTKQLYEKVLEDAAPFK